MKTVYDMTRLPIKQWAEGDRPREKMMRHSKESLSDAELLAILLGSGSRNETAVDLAKRILSSVQNNLAELGKVSLNDMSKFKGMGPVKSLKVLAALELGRRRKESAILERPLINGSQAVFETMHPLLADLQHEEFWALYLNRSNRLVHRENIGKGGLSGTVADSRVIFKIAIQHLASGVIVCHNHPSGSPRPSDSDIMLTRRLRNAGEMLDILVVDHVILTQDTYFSFADEAILK